MKLVTGCGAVTRRETLMTRLSRRQESSPNKFPSQKKVCLRIRELSTLSWGWETRKESWTTSDLNSNPPRQVLKIVNDSLMSYLCLLGFCWWNCQWASLCRTNSGRRPCCHGCKPGQADINSSSKQAPHIQNICWHHTTRNSRWKGIARLKHFSSPPTENSILFLFQVLHNWA